MNKLSQQYPQIAVLIQTNVMKYSARTKLMIARAKNAVDYYQNARQMPVPSPVEANDFLSEEASQPIQPTSTNRKKTGAARLAQDLKGLMDIQALSQGVRNGRRIAMQFSKQLFADINSAGLEAPASGVVKASARSAAIHNALAASRSFAQIVRFEDLDERVKTDWSLFSGDAQIVRTDDVLRVISALTTMEAREMIWLADFEDRGGISLFDLLDTLTTVWEGEFDEPEIIARNRTSGVNITANSNAGVNPSATIIVSKSIEPQQHPSNNDDDDEFEI